MKLFFSFLFFTLFFFQANGQIFNRYVIHGEVNTLSTNSNITYELSPGFSAGIGFSLIFENGYSLTADALYKPVKFKYNSQFTGDLNGSVDNYVKLDFITIPIQVNLILVDNFSITSGCNLNLLVDSKTEKFGRIETNNQTYRFENFDDKPPGYRSFLGLYGGIMYKWKLNENFHLDFKLGIDYGITSIKQNEDYILGCIKTGICLNLIADDKK